MAIDAQEIDGPLMCISSLFVAVLSRVVVVVATVTSAVFLPFVIFALALFLRVHCLDVRKKNTHTQNERE